MQIITKYQAFDGREFFYADECRKYENFAERVSLLMKPLGELPDLPACGFANGGGYVQHDGDTFLKVRNALLEIAKEQITHTWLQESIDNGMDVHSSYAGHIISGYGNRYLSSAWHRIACTDNQFREWGQPYYADNPSKAKQVCLNGDRLGLESTG